MTPVSQSWNLWNLRDSLWDWIRDIHEIHKIHKIYKIPEMKSHDSLQGLDYRLPILFCFIYIYIYTDLCVLRSSCALKVPYLSSHTPRSPAHRKITSPQLFRHIIRRRFLSLFGFQRELPGRRLATMGVLSVSVSINSPWFGACLILAFVMALGWTGEAVLPS